MLKVLIVDDEMWVCKLIGSLINWEDYGYTIVGQAYDGNSALTMISELEPDIVFTDIRMPGMDGLALAQTATEMGVDTKFVIISGYSDFAYAKSALEQGVLDYLLKPVDPDELISLLTRIQPRLTNGPVKEVQLREQLDKSRRQFKEQFLLNYLTDKTKLNNGSLSYVNTEYGTHFSDGLFQALQFKLDEKMAVSSELNQSITAEMIDYLYEQLEGLCFDFSAFRLNLSVIAVANYATESVKQFDLMVGETMQYFRNSLPNIMRYSLTLGKGLVKREFSGLTDSFHSALDAIRARIVLGTDRIIDAAGQQDISTLDTADLFTPQYRNQIIRYIEHADQADPVEIIQAAFQKYHETASPALIFLLAQHTLEIIYTTMRSVSEQFEIDHPKSAADQQLDSINSIEQLTRFLSELLEAAHAMFSNLNNTSSSMIDLLLNYIDEHYNEEISLKELSELVFLNPKYVSELFKKETGINFSDYLASRRIEMAKRFLMDPRKKITEISAQVGYNDSKYFSKLFKKIVGLNPVQYRKLYEQKGGANE